MPESLPQKSKTFTRANQKLAGDLRHLSQTALLEESYAPRVIRMVMVCVSIAILCFIGWAMVTQVNEVARAEGNVVPDGYLQLVQHPEGGIIAHIMVEEGALVKKGQILLELDAKDSSRDLREMQSRRTALMLQAERYRSFLENREPQFTKIAGASAAMIDDQLRMYDDMYAAYEQEKEVIAAQLAQKKQAQSGLASKRRTLESTLSLVGQEMQMQEELLAEGLTSRLRYLDKKKERTTVNGELEATKNQIAESSSAISEFEKRLKHLDATHRDAAYRQMEKIENDLKQHEEMLGKQSNRMQRLAVRAPVDGLVKGLQVNTVGGVIGAGQTLMEIVPLNAPLVVEAKISPKDIGHAETGKPVQVKVHAFDFTRYGAIDGVLEFISATTFVDEHNQSFYRGRVKLQRNYVGAEPLKNIVLPGMTVDAEIITGRKSVLDYLLKPIQTAASTAFTER